MTTKKVIILQDMIITPVVQFCLLLIPFLITLKIKTSYSLDVLESCVVYYFVMVLVTLVFLSLFIVFFPLTEGKFSKHKNPWLFYRWSLWSYIYSSQLYFFSDNILLPPMFRKQLFQLLGAKMGNGIILICAKVSDPQLLEVAENAIIGEGCIITGHLLSSSDKLMLGKIRIKKGAIIGAGSILTPGVTIGENSLVQIASVVLPNTQIPAGEIWGGNPAIKIKDNSLASV